MKRQPLQDEKSGQKVLEGADPTATEVISNNDGLKFSSEQLRNEAVAAYVERWKCSEAALARAARVHPADLSKWKYGLLPVGSDKVKRIEDVLRSNTRPVHASRPSADL